MVKMQDTRSNHIECTAPASFIYDVGLSGDTTSRKIDEQSDAVAGRNGTPEQVMQQVQILMQELEEKRDTDKQMLEEFRARLQTMVDDMCQQVEQRLFDRHQETNKHVELKLQYLNEVVDRVSVLECELASFKDAVSSLYKELHGR